MKNENKIKKNYPAGTLLFVPLFLAAGICLLAFPENALPNAILAIGIFAALYSIVNAALAIADKTRDVKFFFRLLGSVLALFCAIFLLIKRNDGAIDALAAFIGLIAIIDGSFKLQSSALSKRYKIAAWWILLALSVIVICGGFYLVKFPPENKKTLAVIMGLLMIAEGVQNLFATFYSPSVEVRRTEEIINSRQEQPKEQSDIATEDKKSNLT